MQYTIIIRKAPDGFFIASCPVLPDAHAQGKSYEECLANIKEVVELCIEYRKERNSDNTQSTKHGRPWELVYSETRNTLNEARVREREKKRWDPPGSMITHLISSAGF